MRLSTILSSVLRVSAVWATTCYWPSGKAAGDNWLPCPGSKHCCAETEACLSNGLCVAGTYMTVYRGACTDSSWPIAECPRVCYEEVADQWANLYPCPSNDNEVFTCGTSGWASSVCKTQLGKYTWVGGNVTVAQLGVSTSTPSSSATTLQVTKTAISTASCSASSSDNASMKTGVGLGVGLGVPLLLAVAGLLWFYLHTRRQIQSLQQQLKQQGALYSGPRELNAQPPLHELDAGKGNCDEIRSTYRSELN